MLRVATRLVQVSVLVHNKEGRPVTGLTKDDFVLLDGGKERDISFFAVESTASPSADLPPLPPGVFSNELARSPGTPGSFSVILFDTLNTQFMDQAMSREHVIRFLSQIQPQDRIAICSLGEDIRLLHDFSNDAGSLVRAVEAYKGRLNTFAGSSTVEENRTGNAVLDALFDNANRSMSSYLMGEQRIRNTLKAMTAIAEFLGTLPGRKNLIWVSDSFPFSYGYDSPALGKIMPDQGTYNEPIVTACRAVSNANVAIYPVDARGLMGPADIMPTYNAATRGSRPTQGMSAQDLSALNALQHSLETMRVLADRTGGRAFYNTNDIMNSIRRAVDDAVITYQLGFYPRDEDWNLKFHSLKVNVKRPGVEVRHRLGFYALPGPSLATENRQARALEAVRSPLEATRMTLKVRLASPLAAGTPLSFEIMIDPSQITLEPRGGRMSGSIHIAFQQRTAAGKILGTRQEIVNLRLTDETYRRGLADGVSLSRQWMIEPGAEQLRIAVCDGVSDNLGSITVPLHLK